MKNWFVQYIEQYLFYPLATQRVFSLILLPLSFIYYNLVVLKKALSKPKKYGIKILSIGNLGIGGNGKTPFIISLAKEYDDVCIISRGYGRESIGLVVVSQQGDIEVDVSQSGDEAMLIAKRLDNASVVVSEDRVLAIKVAMKMGARLILLDDGFGQFNIAKFDILLSPKRAYTNTFILPSGGYRYPLSFAHYANLNLKEGDDFERVVTIPIHKEDLILITAISKPQRLNEYLPSSVVAKYYFRDHFNFIKQDIDTIMSKHPNAKILTTQKDEVKISDFGYELVVMSLDIKISNKVLADINEYVYLPS